MSDNAYSLAQVIVICTTLVVLQFLTAKSWDLEIVGEAGTLAGTGAVVILLEFIRNQRKKS